MARQNKLSKILRETRLARNLSQTKAAEQIGISIVSYNRLELGTGSAPSYEIVSKLSKWLNVSVEELREWL